ncbi:histidine phosphatase family protein [Aestuariibius sp. HNIBRBA575]|uniref:histidine phosphatase family protein n=1 Tax=Aestuariibius sp. HNIBRBA575 TaxID=3233343 RepID=UPI0034A21D4F
MKRRFHYLSHFDVEIDPDRPVPLWRLNETGRRRAQALTQSGVFSAVDQILSSAETKAIETAAILAASINCPITIHPKMHENDRSSTGFLPGPAFEAAADAFFAHPNTSFKGWETACDAQTRIVQQVTDAIDQFPKAKTILFVGHGAVGTLLYCHLSQNQIDRRFDQTSGGHVLTWHSDAAPTCGWQRAENI